MKLLGQILLVCLILGAIQAVAGVIVIAFMLLIVWGLLFRTKETAGLIALCLLIEALQVHPLVTIGSVMVLIGIFLIARVEPSDPITPGKTIDLLTDKTRGDESG